MVAGELEKQIRPKKPMNSVDWLAVGNKIADGNKRMAATICDSPSVEPTSVAVAAARLKAGSRELLDGIKPLGQRALEVDQKHPALELLNTMADSRPRSAPRRTTRGQQRRQT